MASKQEVADAYGVPISFIDALIKQGHMTVGRGRAGMQPAVVQLEMGRYAHQAYQKLKRASVDETGDTANPEEEDSFRAARIENVKADTRLKMLKEAELKGESAPIDVISTVLSRVGREMFGVIQATPGEIARRCPDVTPRTMEIIQRQLAQAANACADITLSDDDIPV